MMLAASPCDVAAEAAPTNTGQGQSQDLSRLVALAHPCASRHKVFLTKKPLPQILVKASRRTCRGGLLQALVLRRSGWYKVPLSAHLLWATFL